jgi:hypothetical protein
LINAVPFAKGARVEVHQHFPETPIVLKMTGYIVAGRRGGISEMDQGEGT